MITLQKMEKMPHGLKVLWLKSMTNGKQTHTHTERELANGLLQFPNIICRKKRDEGPRFVLQSFRKQKQPDKS